MCSAICTSSPSTVVGSRFRPMYRASEIVAGSTAFSRASVAANVSLIPAINSASEAPGFPSSFKNANCVSVKDSPIKYEVSRSTLPAMCAQVKSQRRQGPHAQPQLLLRDPLGVQRQDPPAPAESCKTPASPAVRPFDRPAHPRFCHGASTCALASTDGLLSFPLRSTAETVYRYRLPASTFVSV